MIRFRIRTKLLVGFLLVALLTAVVSFIGTRNLHEMERTFDEITLVTSPRVVALLRIENAASEVEADTLGLQLAGNESTQAEGTAASAKKYELLASLEKIGRLVEDYHDFVKSADKTRAAQLREIQAAQERVVQASDRLILNKEQKQSASTAAVEAALNQEVAGLKQTVGLAVSSELSKMSKQNKATHANTASLVRLNSIIAVAAVLLALLIGFFTARLITGPLGLVAQAARQIAAGNLRKKIKQRSGDELGQLAQTFNGMTDKLRASHEELAAQKASVERTVVQRTRQLTQEQARFVASINGLPLGFIMTDAGNSIIKINPAMRYMLGFKSTLKDRDEADRLLQSKVGMLQGLLEHSQQSLATGKPHNLSDIEADGKIFRAFIAPIRTHDKKSDKPIGTTVLVEDITEERILARSKDEFFSIASHELRTPLTAIRGNTQMIEQFYSTQLKNPELHEMVGDIHASSIRLIDIVNDFLDASRLEQGKMKFEPVEFSIEEIIEDVVYELDGISREKKVFLHMTNDLDTLPHVYADKNKVKQIVYNLVGNALKFVEHGGVTITGQPEGKAMKISVEDTGRGITPENQQLLFHKFQQANDSLLTRDTTRGTGLGLYISKLLAEKMGGHVALEHSELGKGSTFSFTIPLASKNDK